MYLYCVILTMFLVKDTVKSKSPFTLVYTMYSQNIGTVSNVYFLIQFLNCETWN